MSSKDIQEYLICPITLKLFSDPVLSEDGNTYEREAITQWIVQHGTSPRTKTILKLNQLIPNNTIKNAVEVFKQTSRIDYGENRPSLENLDVLCLYCGLTQKLNNIKDHKLRCSLNPDNIQKFQIENDEDVFAINPKNKSSPNRKIFSFQNPLAHRTNNTTNPENSLQTPTELTKTHRCSFLTNRQIKYFFIILLIIILTGIIITLAFFYIQCRQQHLITGTTTTSTTSPGFKLYKYRNLFVGDTENNRI